MRVDCSDSWADRIDFCSDKCHKRSENVRCPTVISPTAGEPFVEVVAFRKASTKTKQTQKELKCEHLGHPEFNRRGILGLPKIQPQRKPLGHMNTQNSTTGGKHMATQNSTEVGTLGPPRIQPKWKSLDTRRGGWTQLTFCQ